MLAKSRPGRIPKCTKNPPLSHKQSTIPFLARIRTGVFLIGKTIIGRFSNKKLLEQRPMILFRIRSCAQNSCDSWNSCDRILGILATEFLRQGGGFFFYTEIADLCRLGFIYTEIADSWRLDFIYTEIADTLVLAGLNFFLRASRGREGCMYMCIQ